LGYFVITLMLLIGDIRTSDLYKQKDEEKKTEEGRREGWVEIGIER